MAGVVCKYAPQATILPRRVIDLTGGSNDEVVAAAILDLVSDDPDVVNLSLAPAHHDHEEGDCRSTPSTAKAIDILQESCGTMVVVAAGYSDEPWPQDHLVPRGERTTFVGALGVDNEPAKWSDTRDVTFWAPGENVVRFFVHASTPTGQGATRQFSGWATWSGTSFAAPALAGAVATARRPQTDDKHCRRLDGLKDVLRNGLNSPIF